jgi:hypothetical protein
MKRALIIFKAHVILDTFLWRSLEMKTLPKLRKEHISARQWRKYIRHVDPGGQISLQNLGSSFPFAFMKKTNKIKISRKFQDQEAIMEICGSVSCPDTRPNHC